MIECVFMRDPEIGKHLQEFQFVKLDQKFLKQVEDKLADRDLSKIRSESTIDFHAPLAMLATNFSSYHELRDDKESTNVISFEMKPKSGVKEYVPTKVTN